MAKLFLTGVPQHVELLAFKKAVIAKDLHELLDVLTADKLSPTRASECLLELQLRAASIKQRERGNPARWDE
jgi:hypothetical protein